MLRQRSTNPPRGSVNLQPDINTTARPLQTPMGEEKRAKKFLKTGGIGAPYTSRLFCIRLEAYPEWWWEEGETRPDKQDG
jgi:hypothetical protein